jgi:hypothetical protein
MTDAREVVLERRAHPQPRPGLHPGGDCASCATGGALGWSVERVHEALETTRARSRVGWVRVLKDAGAEVVDDVPIWIASYGEPPGSHGLPGVLQAGAWWRHLYVALTGGWYGLASVRHDRRPYDGTHATDTDHLVLLCGARSRWEPVPAVPGASREVLEVLVSCSASCPAGAWENVDDLLRRGAFDVVLARPTEGT